MSPGWQGSLPAFRSMRPGATVNPPCRSGSNAVGFAMQVIHRSVVVRSLACVSASNRGRSFTTRAVVIARVMLDKAPNSVRHSR